jgi:hypothetical protein
MSLYFKACTGQISWCVCHWQNFQQGEARCYTFHEVIERCSTTVIVVGVGLLFNVIIINNDMMESSISSLSWDGSL